MRTIVAGGRDFDDYALLSDSLDSFFESISSTPTIICGGAKGADTLGEIYASKEEYPLVEFPTKWDEYGKSAVYVRNRDMAFYSEALIAFWDGKNKGTKRMIDIALAEGLLVQVVRY